MTEAKMSKARLLVTVGSGCLGGYLFYSAVTSGPLLWLLLTAIACLSIFAACVNDVPAGDIIERAFIIMALTLPISLGGIVTLALGLAGPAAVFYCSVTVAVLSSLALGRLAYQWGYSNARRCVAVVFVCMMLAPLDLCVRGPGRADFLRRTAPAVQAVGLALFSEIDQDNNGILTESEIRNFRQQTAAADQRATLAILADEIAEVGHVASRYTTYTFLWQNTHYVYGIDRSDLRTYPSRIRRKYANW